MSCSSKPVRDIPVGGLLHQPPELQACLNIQSPYIQLPVGEMLGCCLWEVCRYQVWKGFIGYGLDKWPQRRQLDNRVEFCIQEIEKLGFILSCFTSCVPMFTTII